MEARLLGPLSVLIDGAEVAGGGARERTILAMLLLDRNQVVAVERLIDALWGDNPPTTARGQVQICISALRRRFAAAGRPTLIETRRPGYRMRTGAGEVDLDGFQTLTAEARSSAAGGRMEEAEQHLRAALGLWRGTPLADIDSALVRYAAVDLAERYLVAAEAWFDALLALGRHQDVCWEIGTFVAGHPLRERLREQQVMALYRVGRYTEALEAYHRAREVLAAELGVEPGPQLQALYQATLRHDDAAVDDAAPAPAPVVQAVAVVPRQLPPASKDLTGRDDLVERACRHLTTAAPIRVLALTGPAGAGKTAVAVQAAHQVADAFPDGQLFVDLSGQVAGSETTARLLEHMLRTLGVAGWNVPDAVEDRIGMYRSLSADRRMLVVLDNATSEAQVEAFLPASPGCASIVTSRRRLAVLGAAAQMEVGVLGPDAATALLSALVGPDDVAADPGATRLVIRFCGGLPLALRIAAARLISRPHWSIGDLAARLRSERSRLDELVHGDHGVRASISLTYDALDEPARRLLRRLGLLQAGDFGAWVAAPLLDTGADTAAEVLDRLTDARLVEVVPHKNRHRYHLHELLRVYARERLAAEEPPAERIAALRRFLSSVLQLIEEAHRGQYGGDYTVLHGAAERRPVDPATTVDVLADPVRWLEDERAVVVSAVSQAAWAGLSDLCWDIALSAVTLFESGAYFGDWRRTSELALATARTAGDRRGEAAMRYSLGSLGLAEQLPAEAVTHLTVARDMFGTQGDRYGEALALRNLATADAMIGRLDRAEAGYRDAQRVLATVGDPVAEAHVLSSLARNALERDQIEVADEALRQALLAGRRTGSERITNQLGYRIAELRIAQGDYEDAAARLGLVLTGVLAAQDPSGHVYARLGLGILALRQGRLAEADSHLTIGLHLADQVGERLAQGRLLLVLGEVHARLDRTAAAAAALAQALTRFEAIGAVLWQARALDALGVLHADTGDPSEARRWWRQGLEVLRAAPDVSGARLVSILEARLAMSAAS